MAVYLSVTAGELQGKGRHGFPCLPSAEREVFSTATRLQHLKAVGLPSRHGDAAITPILHLSWMFSFSRWFSPPNR